MRHFKTPAREVNSLRFAPDGRSVYLLSVETYITPGSIEALPQHAYRVRVDSSEITGDWPFKPSDIATFSSDFRSIYYWPTSEPYSDETDYRFLHRFDLDSGSTQRVFSFDDVDTPCPNACALSPDGSVLALACIWGKAVVTHRVDLQSATELEPILELIWRGAVRLAYSCDGCWLTICGLSDGVQMWEGTNLVGKWYEPATALAWSFDARLAWGANGRLTVVRPGAGETGQTWDCARDHLSALIFSPDGRWLLSGTKAGICTFHDSYTGERGTTYDWGIGPIHSVAFSPDGLTCAAGGEDGRIVIWDVDS